MERKVLKLYVKRAKNLGEYIPPYDVKVVFNMILKRIPRFFLQGRLPARLTRVLAKIDELKKKQPYITRRELVRTVIGSGSSTYYRPILEALSESGTIRFVRYKKTVYAVLDTKYPCCLNCELYEQCTRKEKSPDYKCSEFKPLQE